MKARIQGSAMLALLLLTGSVIAFGATPGAIATQGQAVVAGQENTETQPTSLYNTASSLAQCIRYTDSGVVGCGQTGVGAQGTQFGLSADGGLYGVRATGPTAVRAIANPGGTGVDAVGGDTAVSGVGNAEGVHGEGPINGVYGKGGENGVQAVGGTFGVFATGTDYGVYASGANHGVYGQATSAGGAGVDAAGSGGALALRVTGKANFSRSGVVTVGAGTSSKSVTLAGVNASSMILATAQQSTSVSVKAAVPAVPSSGSFKIYLTGSAPAGGLKVAYFVLN
jgi:hypothetical protein